MVGRGFLIISALLFFFAAIGVTMIPHPESWAFVALALGMVAGNWSPFSWPKRGP
jgi:hypothetical protein